MRRPNFFGTGSSGSGGSSTTGEIDLRAELDELFFGYISGIRHGHLIVIRHLRRTTEGNPIACTCRGRVTREPDPECSYCAGEGYLWTEEWYWTYSMYSGADAGLASRLKYMPPGGIRVDYKVFFLRYNVPILYGDKVVEIKLDDEGEVIVPYVRDSIYKPQTIQKFRSDNGRVEYIAVHCREEDAIRTDTGA